jgi:hypothetical protein
MSGSKRGERRGGRQKGTPNKITAKRKAEIAASGLTPLDYMLGIVRAETSPGLDASVAIARETLRFEASEAAAPYCHPCSFVRVSATRIICQPVPSKWRRRAATTFPSQNQSRVSSIIFLLCSPGRQGALICRCIGRLARLTAARTLGSSLSAMLGSGRSHTVRRGRRAMT